MSGEEEENAAELKIGDGKGFIWIFMFDVVLIAMSRKL